MHVNAEKTLLVSARPMEQEPTVAKKGNLYLLDWVRSN